MQTMMDEKQDRADSRRYGRRVLLVVLLFFGTFMSVDAYFVTTALRTNTGLVTDKAYEKGLAYNETLEQAAAQGKTGWAGTIDIQNRTLVFNLVDRNGTSLTRARVYAEFKRPVQAREDFSLDLRAVEEGMYQAEIKNPVPSGQWHVRVFALYQGQGFQIARLVTLP